MAILAVVMALMCLGSLVMFVAPLQQGRGLQWSALFLTVMTGLGVWYFAHLARAEYRAGLVRKERGSPDPGA